MAAETPLIVIVGETGSGKSALAMELAEKFNGEIIAADSRTIYRGMDIGTAKPTKAEQTRIKHHLIDVIKPDQTFSAAKFKTLANSAIKDIYSRGKLAIMVGGTGLYVDSVLYNYKFDPEGERDKQNPRHLADGKNRDSQLRQNTLIIGLQLDGQTLKSRLERRVEEMFQKGLVKEARQLFSTYNRNLEAFKTPGYKALVSYLNGEIDLKQAKALFVQADLNLAKRQRTWFKRNKSIHWIKNREKAVDLTTTFLNT